ncbi:hypothetical protein PCE1_003241 [Barthelona sp. PCE]
MSSGGGFDLSCGILSTDGRIYQVEYASKAVDDQETVLGIRCSDGIVLASEIRLPTKHVVEGTHHRLFLVDDHIIMGCAGLLFDGKALVARAREECSNHRAQSEVEPGIRAIADKVAMEVHSHTLHGVYRPYGSVVFIAGVYKGKPELYCINPSGANLGYFANAAGDGRQLAKTELERLNLADIDVDTAVVEMKRIMDLLKEDATIPEEFYSREMMVVRRVEDAVDIERVDIEGIEVPETE